MYNDKVLDHFANPRNVGSIENPDGVGQVGNSVDGDKINIYIKVQGGALEDVRFKTLGCGAAIAASSMLTELAKGKTLEEGMKITNDDVAQALGGLPPHKLKCSNIAADALHEAIKNYLSKEDYISSKIDILKPDIPKEQPDAKEGLTDRDQIQRYLRHIIMPKISGAGQKKIIETSIVLYAESVDACQMLMNYMAAVGIGSIHCFLGNKEGFDLLSARLGDLNPNVKIGLALDSLENALNTRITSDFNIIIGGTDFVNKVCATLSQYEVKGFSPTFAAVVFGHQGYIGLYRKSESLLSDLSSANTPTNSQFQKLWWDSSYAFAGTFLVNELIKARLEIGKAFTEPLYFDLLETSFEGSLSVSNENTTLLESCDFNHPRVLIVGAGGLGSPAAFILAKAGVENIGLVDFDNVEISNLNRQILHTTSKIGLKKVESAKKTLNAINPNINIKIHPTLLSKDNVFDIIKDYDIIIDALDNLPTRYLLSDACYFKKKPLIEAGVLTFYGQVITIIPDEGPCYRCLFRETDEPQSVPSCSETGILGPVAGLTGILQGVEVLKILTGVGSSLVGKLLLYDALETDFSIIEMQKNIDCGLCSEHPSITQLGEYTFECKD